MADPNEKLSVDELALAALKVDEALSTFEIELAAAKEKAIARAKERPFGSFVLPGHVSPQDLEDIYNSWVKDRHTKALPPASGKEGEI